MGVLHPEHHTCPSSTKKLGPGYDKRVALEALYKDKIQKTSGHGKVDDIGIVRRHRNIVALDEEKLEYECED